MMRSPDNRDLPLQAHCSESPSPRPPEIWNKHCQRHNGPEGWVLITRSCTHLDQVSIFRILIHHKLQNLKQTVYRLAISTINAQRTQTSLIWFVILWSETFSDNLKSKPTWVTPQARPVIRRLWMSVISVIEDWQHGARRQSSCWAQGLTSRNLLPITAKD